MHRKLTSTILCLAAAVGCFSSSLNGQDKPDLLPPAAPIAPDVRFFGVEGQNFPIAGFVGQRGNATDQALAKAIEKYRKAESDSDARRQAKDEIAKLLGEQYDAYMKDQEKHLDQMEQKLAKLREQLKLRKDGKQKMVGLKLEMVMAQLEGLGWPEQGSDWMASPLQSHFRFATPNTVSRLLDAFGAEPVSDDELPKIYENETEAPQPLTGQSINRSR